MNEKSNNSQEYPTVNRKYKDRLFRLVFSKKEDLLSLYNAITVQSTFNPNMPTRALLYFARMYEDHIAKHEINIYSSTPKKLPFPQHIVFYNGTKDEPDRTVLKLSDLFETPPTEMTPCLECTSTMLNINYGHNRELMEKCQRLKEYAVFVDTVRRNLNSGLELKQAVSFAVDECTAQGILEDSTLTDIQQKYDIPQNEIISEIMAKYDLTEAEVLEKLQKYRT